MQKRTTECPSRTAVAALRASSSTHRHLERVPQPCQTPAIIAARQMNNEALRALAVGGADLDDTDWNVSARCRSCALLQHYTVPLVDMPWLHNSLQQPAPHVFNATAPDAGDVSISVLR